MRVTALLRAPAAPLAATVLALSVLAACATSSSIGAGAGGAGGSSGVTSTAAGPTGPVDPTGTATLPGSPPPLGASVSEEGTVVEGAEPSCLMLQTQNGLFELLGTSGIKVGDKLRVTGSVVHVMSHCMQGRPFEVTALTHL